MAENNQDSNGTTTVFLLAGAILLFCTFMVLPGGHDEVHPVGLLATIAVVLTGSVIRALEQKD